MPKAEYVEQHPRLLEYLLGLLNSRLLFDYLKNISTPLRGGWFRPFPQFLKRLPIKLPSGAAERNWVGEVAMRARRVVVSWASLRGTAVCDRERRDLESSAESDERAIEDLVSRLYGVAPSALPSPPA